MLKSLEKKYPERAAAEKRAKILCVDDEAPILKVMQRGLSDDFEVLEAAGGLEGLQILKLHPDIVVIISDHKMPAMSGTEFLTQSQAIVPDAVRIMLTAHSDMNVMMDSINEGQIYKFILKPFDMEILRITLKRAVEHYYHKKAFEKAYRELLATQEQLVRSEKMSMLGKLMSGVAHELSQPVSSINHASTLAQFQWVELRKIFDGMRFAAGSNKEIGTGADSGQLPKMIAEFDSVIGTIKSASDLAIEIIQDLRGFSRLDDAEWVPVHLQDQIERAIHLVQTKYKHQVQFHRDFGDVPPILGLSGPLTQVMVNLIHNSAQSIESDGHIWITTRSANGHVIISVKDNGRGIPPENIGRIFEIGFTTKPEQDGAGLGLAISHNIVEKHGGMIEVSSTPGEGSEFVVTLPVHHHV